MGTETTTAKSGGGIDTRVSVTLQTPQVTATVEADSRGRPGHRTSLRLGTRGANRRTTVPRRITDVAGIDTPREDHVARSHRHAAVARHVVTPVR